MILTIEHDVESDGRWIAEVLELPGVLVYAATLQDATRKAQALTFLTLHDRLEHDEMSPVEYVVFVRTIQGIRQ